MFKLLKIQICKTKSKSLETLKGFECVETGYEISILESISTPLAVLLNDILKGD